MRQILPGNQKTKTTLAVAFVFTDLSYGVYFLPFLPAFFASISFFASKRFGDL